MGLFWLGCFAITVLVPRFTGLRVDNGVLGSYAKTIEACTDIHGAAPRTSRAFPLCKCKEYDARVFCGNRSDALGLRYFDVSTIPACRERLRCASIENYSSAYDCDGDGIVDCGDWSFTTLQCTSNHGKCTRKRRFGDLTPSSSCRCDNKCSSKAQSDPKVLNGADFFGRWKNWVNYVESCAPWMMPKNDDDLRRLLQYARAQGYKVRPSGAAHSAAGLVTDGSDSKVVVVSLAHYKIDDSDAHWEYALDESRGLVTVNAGWTPLKLYSRIRPKNFFLPTQTAGYFFQLGGIVANSVHGAGYQRSFLHSYVTRMRVMMSDGTIKLIDKEEDLKYWRNSYGLLGIITAVEFRLDKRDKFQMFTKTRRLANWNEDAFWEFLKRDAEADFPMDMVLPGGSEGTRAALGGEIFVTLMDDKPQMMVVSSKANEHANEDGIASGMLGFDEADKESQANHSENEAQELEQRYTELGNTLIRERGENQVDYLTSAGENGIPPFQILRDGADESGMIVRVNKIINICTQFRFSAKACSHFFASQTLSELPGLVDRARRRTNDGFFILFAPETYIAAYFLPPDKAFEAFNSLRTIQRNSKEFDWNQPAEFRFMNVTDDAVLQPVQPGYYFVSEVLAFPGGSHREDDWKMAFKSVEDHWVGQLGAKPHVGKLFGFGFNSDGQIQPFSHYRACTVYSDEQKDRFNAYRQRVDPTGLFAHGFSMKLLKTC